MESAKPFVIAVSTFSILNELIEALKNNGLLSNEDIGALFARAASLNRQVSPQTDPDTNEMVARVIEAVGASLVQN